MGLGLFLGKWSRGYFWVINVEGMESESRLIFRSVELESGVRVVIK